MTDNPFEVIVISKCVNTDILSSCEFSCVKASIKSFAKSKYYVFI